MHQFTTRYAAQPEIEGGPLIRLEDYVSFDEQLKPSIAGVRAPGSPPVGDKPPPALLLQQVSFTEIPKDVPLEPVEGVRAWIVVLGSFLIHVSVLGFFYSFGVFLPSYELEFNATSAAVSLANTIGVGAFFFVGVVSGRLAERFPIRLIVFSGSLIYCLSLVAAAFSNNLSETALCHGFLLGAGTSMMYFPCVAVVPQWFAKRRSTAQGLTTLGAGIGSIVASLLTENLIETYGWRKTLLIFPAGSFGIHLIAIACLKRRLPLQPRGATRREAVILKDRNFQIYLLMTALFQFAYMIPYVLLYSFAVNLGISTQSAALILGFIGIGSMVGRLVLSFSGDYFNAFRVMRFAVLMQTLTMFLWILCTTVPTLIAFAFFYGFFSGGFIASSPVVLADAYGAHRLGVIIGFTNLAAIIPGVAGAPLAAYIYLQTKSFIAIQVFGGSLLLLCFFSMLTFDTSKLSSVQKEKIRRETLLPPESS